MQRYTHTIGWFAGAMCAFMLLPVAASAQQSISIKIQPTLIEQKVNPGDELHLKLNVTNLGPTTEDLYTNTRNITGIGADGHPIYSNEKDEASFYLASWITFDQKELKVAPGGTQEVSFTVKVPADASPGSHFGAVLLTKQPPAEFLNGTGVGYEVGSVMNLQISGKIVEDARILAFQTSQIVYGDPKVHFTTKVENNGNIFVRPRGLVEIHSMFGKKVATIPVNDSGAGVFPRATREFETDWLPEDLQIGRYDAVVALSFGDQAAQTISAENTFWILPNKIIIPLLGGILLLVIIVYALLRLYINRQLAAARAGVRSSFKRDNAVGLSRLAAVIIAILVSVIIGLLVLFFYFG